MSNSTIHGLDATSSVLFGASAGTHSSGNAATRYDTDGFDAAASAIARGLVEEDFDNADDAIRAPQSGHIAVSRSSDARICGVRTRREKFRFILIGSICVAAGLCFGIAAIAVLASAKSTVDERAATSATIAAVASNNALDDSLEQLADQVDAAIGNVVANYTAANGPVAAAPDPLPPTNSSRPVVVGLPAAGTANLTTMLFSVFSNVLRNATRQMPLPKNIPSSYIPRPVLAAPSY